MSKRVDSVPPIVQDLVNKLWESSSQDWARENVCLQLENIAHVAGAEARRFRKKQHVKSEKR